MTLFPYTTLFRSYGQFGFLVNVPRGNDDNNPVPVEYVCGLLGKGFDLNTIGNRLFFVAMPLFVLDCGSHFGVLVLCLLDGYIV